LGSLHNLFNRGALLWGIFRRLGISTLLILLSLEVLHIVIPQFLTQGDTDTRPVALNNL